MFPEDFLRQDPVTSFFVSDFTEVDDNVTRHLESEMTKSDWDVMILHYLGLDHIGHLEGPDSHLVQPKLDEMSQNIKFIWYHYRKNNHPLPVFYLKFNVHKYSMATTQVSSSDSPFFILFRYGYSSN